MATFLAIVGVAVGVIGIVIAAAALLAARKNNVPIGIDESKESFKMARRTANANRVRLSQAAAELEANRRSGGQLRRVPPSSLLYPSSWMFDQPYPLTAVRLAPLENKFEPPPLNGLRPVITRQLPLRPSGRYDSVPEAIEELDPPKGAFENRISYRLLEFTTTPTADEPHMKFALCRYFDMLDVGESLTMEFALSRVGRTVVPQTSRYRPPRRLPIRRLLGDPTDLRRHPVLPAINTLTIRLAGDGRATFFAHLRGAEDVPVAAGQTHVIPCGGFQPSAKSQLAIGADFDLWRSLTREYAEEFLGLPEALGDGGDPIDYNSSPYAELAQGVQDGTIRPWIFGAAFDPLSYYVEVLTATVFDAPVFDAIFPKVVDRNPEGLVLKGSDGRGIEFTEEKVKELLNDTRMAPAGAACLSLALEHREALLGKAPAAHA